jgi:hypothetical protein
MRLIPLPKLYLRKKSSLPFLYRMGLTGTHKLELGISPMRQCCREEDLRSEHGFRHSHLFNILSGTMLIGTLLSNAGQFSDH